LDKIRVTYSGLISITAGLLSVITGLGFLIIITRLLDPFEYGSWNFINGLFVYILPMEPIISYWVKREIPRGSESGKTAILSSGIFSVGGILLYIVISSVVGSQTDANISTLFLASILIPVIFINSTLRGIAFGSKPEFASYGPLLVSSLQMIFAIIFIYFLEFAVEGIIFASFFAYLITILVLLYYFRDLIRVKIKTMFVKKWVKLSWIPIYPILISTLYRSDIVIFTLITNSVVGLAYWSAAIALTIIIQQSAYISKGAYPKLLQEKDSTFLKTNITHLFYFTIPATALTMTFARPGLFALNPIYESVQYVVILLSLQIFLKVISGTFESYIKGSEEIDTKKEAKIRDYLKSKLFSIPSIRLIQNASFVIFFTMGLYFLVENEFQQDKLLLFWASIGLVTQIPHTIYLYWLVREHFSISFEIISIVKYVIIGFIVFGLMHILIENFVTYDQALINFIPQLIPLIISAFGLYVIITYITDKQSKILVNAVIDAIKNKIL